VALYSTITTHFTYLFCVQSVLCFLQFYRPSHSLLLQVKMRKSSKIGMSSRQLKSKAIYSGITLICSMPAIMLAPLIF